jgi:predicted AlkP superfamily phosphohydrolase/phosphomutase
VSRRVIALAVDSADVADVERGIAEGWLPTLKGILDRGTSVLMEGPNIEFPGGTWPTTITGTPPTEHTVLFERQLRPGTHRMEHVTTDDLARPPFWRFAHEAGRRTTLASIYAAPVLRPFNGTQVIGWGSYDPFTTKLSKPRIEPADARDLLRAVAPSRRSGFLPRLPTSEDDFRAYAARGLGNVRDQGAGLRVLIERTEWDLFLGSFAEPHESGHILWRFHDPEHAEHDPAAPSDLRDSVRNLYRAIDTEIGSILAAAPGDAVVLVYTPLGMAPHTRLDNSMEVVLTRSGLLRREANVASAAEPRLRAAMGARRMLHAVVPIRARRQLGRLVPFARRKLLTAMELADVDWAATRAFSIGSDGTTMIRINLKGREPLGIVAPDEYERTIDEITRIARDLVDADTGKPVVAEVIRVDRLLGRPVDGAFPDLVVTWERLAARRLRSPACGEFDVPMHDPRTGEHQPTGFVIAAGPGIASSSSGNGLGPDTWEVTDLAPTLLANLGIPLPEALSGRPITPLLAG